MEKPTIGLLGLTLELYKNKLPTLMSQLEGFSGELKDILSECAYIVHYPLAWNRATVSQAFASFAKAKTDGIILVLLSYSQSLAILPSIKKSKIPLLIWNTQKLKTIDENFAPKDSSDNHGMHGVQDLASVLLREKIKFSLITGHCMDKKILSEVCDWCMASRVVTQLKKARIGRIGSLFPDMGDFAINPEVLKSAIGTETLEITDKETSLFEKFPDASAQEIKRYFDFRMDWSQEISHKTRTDSLKAFFFLKHLSEKQNISGWAINFEGLNNDMPMPFLGISRLMSQGMGYGGEGDVYSATVVLLAQMLSDNQATFAEMFTTDYKNSRIYMTHMGESNLGIRRKNEPVRMVLNKMVLGNGVPTAVPVFSIMPGEYTLINLTACGQKELKLIISLVKVLDRKPFKKMVTPHFLLSVCNKSVEEFLTLYSMQAGTHHLAVASGDIRRKVKFFGYINNIDVVEI